MWIQLSSGQGPKECELAVGNLLKVLLSEYECAKVIDAISGKYPRNFKSVLLSVENPQSGKKVEVCQGTILWICQSPYRPGHKRKNWFIDINIFGQYEKLNFSESDIKFDYMRSSGPGGQNVNKVETAVRAVHLPTGLTTLACEERSQHMNKKLALARMAELIKSKNAEKLSNQKKSLWMQHNTLTRGNPIRIFEGKNFKEKKI